MKTTEKMNEICILNSIDIRNHLDEICAQYLYDGFITADEDNVEFKCE